VTSCDFFIERRKRTPTETPKLRGREKQTAKTGAHGRRKEGAEKKIENLPAFYARI
jgi:hypothetical protein